MHSSETTAAHHNAVVEQQMMNPTATEEEQQIVPVYGLLLSSDESPSASLRVASVYDDQRVDIRCAISADSTHAFIPGTLTLHKNGKRVGTTADDGGTVFTRRTVTVENSLHYNFVPWPTTHRQRRPTRPSADEVIILNKESDERPNQEQWHNQNRRRHHRTKKHKTRSDPSVFSSADHSVIFHCSALARPSEARRRGRVPDANLYQRTLKMMRSIGPNECTKGVAGRSCEQSTIPQAMVSAFDSPFVLCASFLLLAFLLSAALTLGLALLREKKRRRPRTVKAMLNQMDDINEKMGLKSSEQIYEAADYRREQSPIPTRHATMQNGQTVAGERRICSEGSGYDNLERLREEIRRQKAALEGKRRKGAENGFLLDKVGGHEQFASEEKAPNWWQDTAKHSDETTQGTERRMGRQGNELVVKL